MFKFIQYKHILFLLLHFLNDICTSYCHTNNKKPWFRNILCFNYKLQTSSNPASFYALTISAFKILFLFSFSIFMRIINLKRLRISQHFLFLLTNLLHFFSYFSAFLKQRYNLKMKKKHLYTKYHLEFIQRSANGNYNGFLARYIISVY